MKTSRRAGLYLLELRTRRRSLLSIWIDLTVALAPAIEVGGRSCAAFAGSHKPFEPSSIGWRVSPADLELGACPATPRSAGSRPNPACLGLDPYSTAYLRMPLWISGSGSTSGHAPCGWPLPPSASLPGLSEPRTQPAALDRRLQLPPAAGSSCAQPARRSNASSPSRVRSLIDMAPSLDSDASSGARTMTFLTGGYTRPSQIRSAMSVW